jgi:hypothetical protein
VPKDEIVKVLNSPPPVPVVGPAGQCVIFHCNLLRLGTQPVRRGPLAHLHLVQYLRQRAEDHRTSRPDWVVSRNTRPLRVKADVLQAA